ncbi:MAG: hypothetical protein ABIR47_11815, partial [Candidatus Kapaibacterium sp.]
LLAGTNPTPSIDYTVSIPSLAAETFYVTATLHNVIHDTTTFYFPIWAPGAYDVVNFGRFVRDFSAVNTDGSPITIGHPDSNSFTLSGVKNGDVKIVYNVHDIGQIPNSMWFCLSDIQPNLAFAVGAALFGYPSGGKDVPYTVRYNLPTGWDIAIGLDPMSGGKNTYRARDYDELIDAPLDMGKFQRYDFKVNGKPHVITVHSPTPLNAATGKSIVDMTKKIVEQETKFFGDMPYDRYIFQHYLVEPGPGDSFFGALEHRNSSTYRMPYVEGEDLIQELAPVIAHEYWHLWSPKRMHVKQLGPFDYQHPPRTASLWFAEGLTEYYAKVFMLRNGMGSRERFLGETNGYVASSYGKPQTRSMTELSMQLPDLPTQETIGLYTKGPILGMLLDIAIRQRTRGKMSLDDVMRRFNDDYGKTGRTFTDEEIIPEMEKITGVKLDDFYTKYIAGHEPLPYDEFLPAIGLKISSKEVKRPVVGGTFEKEDNGLRVASVSAGGTLDSTGLKVGDVLEKIALGTDGQGQTVDLKDAPPDVLDQVFAQVPASVRLSFVVRRNGGEVTVPITYALNNVTIHRMEVDDHAPAAAVAARKQMLNF